MQIFEDENQLNNSIIEARKAYDAGTPEGGSVRLGQADALLKMDVGLLRHFRKVIEEEDPSLANESNNLRSFVLSYICMRWLRTLEDQITMLYQEQAAPLISRPEVAVVIASAVHEQVRRRLAKEGTKAA